MIINVILFSLFFGSKLSNTSLSCPPKKRKKKKAFKLSCNTSDGIIFGSVNIVFVCSLKFNIIIFYMHIQSKLL